MLASLLALSQHGNDLANAAISVSARRRSFLRGRMMTRNHTSLVVDVSMMMQLLPACDRELSEPYLILLMAFVSLLLGFV